MEIEIVVPTFKCEEDEKIFFSRLHGIDGFEGVVGKGFNLHLSLIAKSGEGQIRELQSICNMWGTSFKVLN